MSCKQCVCCPNGVHSFAPQHTVSRERCTQCGKCVSVCPTDALQLSHRELSNDEYFALVARQKRLSGNEGGITFSGGEPLLQGEALIDLINNTDAHTAIETCGYADERLFRRVIECVDYVMFDLKLADDALHQHYTGVSNALILRNLEHLRVSGKPFILRTPLIPGITHTEENLAALSTIVGDDEWEKLEYNALTPTKYQRIGKPFLL